MGDLEPELLSRVPGLNLAMLALLSALTAEGRTGVVGCNDRWEKLASNGLMGGVLVGLTDETEAEPASACRLLRHCENMVGSQQCCVR